MKYDAECPEKISHLWQERNRICCWVGSVFAYMPTACLCLVLVAFEHRNKRIHSVIVNANSSKRRIITLKWSSWSYSCSDNTGFCCLRPLEDVFECLKGAVWANLDSRLTSVKQQYIHHFHSSPTLPQHFFPPDPDPAASPFRLCITHLSPLCPPTPNVIIVLAWTLTCVKPGLLCVSGWHFIQILSLRKTPGKQSNILISTEWQAAFS